jgi:hypothetical protein
MMRPLRRTRYRDRSLLKGTKRNLDAYCVSLMNIADIWLHILHQIMSHHCHHRQL